MPRLIVCLLACALLRAQPGIEAALHKLQSADFQAAQHLLSAEAVRNPGNAAVWNLLGIAETELGHSDPADSAFQKALRLQPLSPVFHENYGSSLYRRSDFERAKPLLTKAIELGANRPGVALQLAIARVRTGEGEAGLRDLRSLEQPFSSSAEYWEERGLAEAGSDPAAAHTSFDRALALNTRSVRSLIAIAVLAEREGNTEKALAFLLKARSLSPPDSQLLVQLGRVCLKRDLGQDAITLLEEARRLAPADRTALYLLGAAHITVEKYERAYELLQDFTREADGNPSAHYSLAWLDLKLNRPQPARKHLEQALQLAPDFTAALLDLAELDLQEGKLERVAEQIGRVLRIDPRNARAHLIQGDIQIRQDDAAQAKASYTKAIELNASLAAAHSRLARILFREKDTAGAEREQRIAAELNEATKGESRRALRLATIEGVNP